MPSKLIVLPTESTLGAHGLSKGNGKRVATSDDDSDTEGACATGAAVTVSRARENDVASEGYPDSDADDDSNTRVAPKQAIASHRKKVRSEGGSSSGTASEHGSVPSLGASLSMASTTLGSRVGKERLATVTVSTAIRKPTVWDNYYRKQQEAAARKGGGCTATPS
jgi:hypothetical protein